MNNWRFTSCSLRFKPGAGDENQNRVLSLGSRRLYVENREICTDQVGIAGVAAITAQVRGHYVGTKAEYAFSITSLVLISKMN
jgi:hypothetical protein